MRVAILSDTHFGDDLGTLVVEEPGRAPCLGPAYPALARAVGRVDYLVLLGDVLDFSVASFEKAYRHAKVFFAAVQADGLASQLIYVPGNHDFDIWHTVEHQVNVLNQLKQGALPRAFKRSVPGVIDDRRTDPAEKFRLPAVTAKPDWHDNRANYGNLFLDHITLNQLACTGIGQAAPLTAFIRRIQRDVDNGRLGELARTLDRLEERILANRWSSSRMRRAAERYVIRWIKRWILSTPHQPIAWGAGELVDEVNGRAVHFCNTGGWLLKDDDRRTFAGAEVVIYESGRELRSHAVRSHDLMEAPQLVPAS